MAIQSYKDLIVWQKSMDLADMIYKLSANWPKEETYGLTNQIRRAAVSIPSNIAEGYGRMSQGEYKHHLAFARGSLVETETQIELSRRFGYSTQEQIAPIIALQNEIGKMLWSMLTKL